MPGTLYLIPTPLGKSKENEVLPDFVVQRIRKLDVLVVENIHTTSRFLEWIGETVPTYNIEFYHLNKRTPEQEIYSFLKPLKQNKDVGLLSEAGAPGVADPGAKLVKMAHQRSIKVVPLVGPSSILLALMASGFNGQQFSFHGYLPIDEKNRKQHIIQLEGESRRHDRTQLFMEAPHRNLELVQSILKYTQNDTKLLIATDLTLSTEYIRSQSVADWKKGDLPDIQKRPTIFGLYAK
ncbi:MAG: SAM-dependent methyltransferase [Bacteroidota bacterium]